MAHAVDTALLERIRRCGAFEVGACFNCGNCSAVCPLSGDRTNFPRRLIRYAQVGLQDRLLADKDLWLCYSCGECTQTCPRQASPSEFMAAARRYAISRADATGFSRLLYGSPLRLLVSSVVLSAAVALVLLSQHGVMAGPRLTLFGFIPGPWVHVVGLGVFAAIGIVAVAGLGTTGYRMLKETPRLSFSPRRLLPALVYAITESLAQFRFRECDTEQAPQPWYEQPRVAHALVFWGFLGMLGATALDFLLKPIGSAVPPWHPARLLGMAAGLLCLIGLSLLALRRFRKVEPAVTTSHFSDWFFLALLFAVVATGLVTELAVYLPASRFAYGLFLGHVVLAMDLLLLLPATKFAHVLYRPLALLAYGLQISDRKSQTADSASAI